MSEPDVIIQIAKQDKPWSVVVGLIGEGQEIHLGEESGIGLWNKAIEKQDIQVHSKHMIETFTEAAQYNKNENLHLNCSLRTHAAIEYFDFVNKLLDGDIVKAADIKKQLKGQRYIIHVTRNLDLAKSFVSILYNNDIKKYGIVCASGNDKSKDVAIIPFPQRYERPKPIVKYFNYPETDYYCSNLLYAATEFHTQGLELDMAIAHWDDDLYWLNGKWHSQYTKKGAHNPMQIKLNAYRVLLTRGRDGMILYIPKKKTLDPLYRLLAVDLNIQVLK